MMPHRLAQALRILIFAARAAAVAILICGPAVAGGAVVMDLAAASKAKLPNAETLKTGKSGLAQPYQRAGLSVATDPTGRIVAAWTPKHPGKKPPRPGYEERWTVHATAIMEQTTIQQLTTRKMGYLFAEQLLPDQLRTATLVARTMQFIDKQGKPKRAGERVAVEIAPVWMLHVATPDRGSGALCVETRSYSGPPSALAIPADPLKGSPLWYSWPGFGGKWGDEKVSIQTGTYSVASLLSRLTRAACLSFEVRSAIGSAKLAVSAQDVSAHDLLWAIVLVSGAEAKVSAHSDGVRVKLLEPGYLSVYYRDHDSLLPIRTLGYYTPASCANGRKMFSRIAGGADDLNANWLMWRVSDLPLLYQDDIRKAWLNSRYAAGNKVSEPEIDTAYAIWTKSIRVGIGTFREDASGGGIEVRLPAF